MLTRSTIGTLAACVIVLFASGCGGDAPEKETAVTPTVKRDRPATTTASATTPQSAAATIAAATEANTRNSFVADPALREPATGGVAAFATLRQVLDPTSRTPAAVRCQQVAGLDPMAPESPTGALQIRRGPDSEYLTDVTAGDCEKVLGRIPTAEYAQLFTPESNLKWARFEAGGCSEINVIALPSWLLAFRNASPKLEDAQRWEVFCVGLDNATKRWLITGSSFHRATLAEALQSALGEVPAGLPEESDVRIATITPVADPMTDPDVLAAGKVARLIFGSATGIDGPRQCRLVSDTPIDDVDCESVDDFSFDPDMSSPTIAARVSGVSDALVEEYQKKDHLLLGYGDMGDGSGLALAFVREKGEWKYAAFAEGVDESAFVPEEESPDDETTGTAPETDEGFEVE